MAHGKEIVTIDHEGKLRLSVEPSDDNAEEFIGLIEQVAGRRVTGVYSKDETQRSISEWANETFGPAGSNARVAARANEEMAELLREWGFEGEQADTAIRFGEEIERRTRQRYFSFIQTANNGAVANETTARDLDRFFWDESNKGVSGGNEKVAKAKSPKGS